MHCPVCSAAQLEAFHDGGEVPVFVNVLHDDAASARATERGRLVLGACGRCGFVHNVEFDPARVEYAPGYENSLHGSPTFDDWAREAAQALVGRHGLRGGEAVDVGGGRGEFMALLVGAGLGRGLVADPSAPDGADGAAPAAVQVVRRLFHADDVTPEVRLVLSRHVLEHLHDPLPLTRQMVAAAARVDAALYVEVPNGLFTLRDLGVWDLIYEHCSYFTSGALQRLLERAGAAEIELREDFHGQFLVADARPSAQQGALRFGSSAACAGVDILCRAFAHEHRALVSAWCSALDARRGQRVALWGAGSKGATFLNTVPGARGIDCAVDVNPLKHGKFVAGTGHPIVAPEELAGRRVDAIIVLNPAYEREIATQAAALGLVAEVLTVDAVRGSAP